MKKIISYRRLSPQERHTIQILRESGDGVRAIARKLNRSPSTISREIKKGLVRRLTSNANLFYYAYNYAFAQEVTNQRRKKLGAKIKIENNPEVKRILSRLIKKGYSPYAALIIAKKENLFDLSLTVRTVYRYVHQGVLDVTELDLPVGFNRKSKKKIPFNKRKDKYSRDPLRVSIEQRPLSVLSRKDFGHWEGDTVVSKKDTSVLLTLLERKTRYLIAFKLDNKKSESVKSAFDLLELKLGKDLFSKVFKTLTLDNGTEFSNIALLQKSAFADKTPEQKRLQHIFFTHPFCSSERGSNENVHRFIRRKYPKKSSFKAVTDTELQNYIDWVNTYPRKLFNGKCALEQFLDEIKQIA